MSVRRLASGVLVGLGLSCAAQASAHFKLLEPASWLNEDDLGAPQKGSPCGPGDTRLFIGDDVQPVPVSGAVTTYRAGETITVRWEETIYHPGYFRISIAATEAASATSADFPDPPLTDAVECYYDRDAVQTVPHDDVLADGLFMVEEVTAPGRSLMQEITLPTEPCERCTLQVVQVMEGHGASSCYYFHCAEIEILPAEDGAAGASGEQPMADAGGGKGGDGGCAVTGPRAAGQAVSPLVGALIVGLALVRRRRRPA